jgi:uncharacterized membrane protein
MTRTYVMASSRPFTASATSIGARRARLRRRLLALPVGLLLAIAPAASALAAESGYGNTPTPPSSTPSSTPPASGTSPSKSSSTPTKTSTPEKETAPSKEKSAPSKEKESTPAAKSSTKALPFTGLDLRWIVGIGLVLMVAGCSILVAQRRHRTDR